MRKTKPFDEKYVPVTETGCWLWTSGWDSDGYGLLSGNVKAHRESYARSFGPIPDGMCVCHKCDTPSCVNPGHLFLGTTQDNTRDRVEKRRGAIGERSPHAKLTIEQVAEVLASKESKRSLAKRFGVTHGCIAHIRKGRSWKVASHAGVFIAEPWVEEEARRRAA